MSLRRQLLLVSLLLLAIPWAGVRFVQEIEHTLRKGQAQALEATARAVAASFGERPELLYPWPQRTREPASPETSLYVRPAEGPVQVDGYADGWPEGWSGSFSSASGTPPTRLRYQAMTRNGQLYLLLAIDDAQVVYNNPGLSPEANGDRVLLRTWENGRRQEYVIATAAPGNVRGRHAGAHQRFAAASRIAGYWQDTESGYTLELALPLAMTGGRLGIEVIDVGNGERRTAGNIDPLDTSAPPWLLYPPPGLDAALRAFAGPGQTLLAYDAWQWELAAANAPDNVTTREQHTFWLLQWIYRRILDSEDYPPLPATSAHGRLEAAELVQALHGQPGSRWYRTDGGRHTVLAAAAPVMVEGRAVGAIVVRQGLEQYLSLTDRAFSRLLGYSLLAIAIAALGLLGYASVLSWRIGRLGRAARQVSERGRINLAEFPRSDARDEIGELSRSYAGLLAELDTYNEYLRTLSRKLSHELRTPVAVIQSSLDNLEQAEDVGERLVYVQRSREGLQRLTRILAAMTEASRVEDSVRGSALAPLDLRELLEQMLQTYRDICPSRQFTLEAEQPALVQACADLVVQALDKLVENAVTFSPEGSVIAFSLRPMGRYWALAVENQGPVLPEALRGRVFEAMVSVRGEQPQEQVHLGLGLYIVKLIVEYLGGEAQALNRTDGSGVIVRLLLPRLESPGSES
ncbi:hypothetical protein E4634_10895 [Mangrovimicrobium sediminis]|uniref:histidine kinase n=1 Tax=Mangrovimicrobium sediminis TaxID=2562682 RepID=A0A4Z0M272_9GAMM|nr:ATP-binding protein [Haliea sp. SAOS-164]TGD73527.1 hypothetical protein E4634_10895 [Haliea sp. SAOS-164]